MDIFVKVLNILPLLNSKKSLLEIDAEELFKCQKFDFTCIFDELSTLPRKTGGENTFIKGLYSDCTKASADFAKASTFSRMSLPCFSEGGETKSKTVKNIEDVVESLSVFYKNYILNVSDPYKQAERLGTSLLIYEFFKEGYDLMPPEFCKSESGKPFFADFPAVLSVSHSGGLICCAFAPKNDMEFSLGIDAEAVPPAEKYPTLKRISERFFDSPLRVELLNGLNESEFCDAFTLIWTKKESLVKMTGEGLSGIKKEPPSNFLQSSYELFPMGDKTKYYISISLNCPFF